MLVRNPARNVIPPAQSVEDIYNRHCLLNTAMTLHLPRLRALAEGLELVVEFGVKRGASSSALLLGAKHVVSYDIRPTAEAMELQRVAGERWQYRITDSRTANVPSCDLLFVDSQHDFETCDAELHAHADKAKTYLAFHDTITFGSVGANGETGEHKWQYKRGQWCPQNALGIRPAIDALMMRDDSWRIHQHYTDSHGLLILKRASA